jgi:hypothetical protein
MVINDDANWLFELRGRLEKILDSFLSYCCLSSSRELFETLKPAVRNVDDAVFGSIWGQYERFLYDFVRQSRNRPPNSEEIQEGQKAFLKRIFEIQSRIYETKR